MEGPLSSLIQDRALSSLARAVGEKGHRGRTYHELFEVDLSVSVSICASEDPVDLCSEFQHKKVNMRRL